MSTQNSAGLETPKRFKTYTLPKLLPEGDVLVLDSEQSILTWLHAGQVVEQQLFSPGESFVVEALLDLYPDYCPHEVALSKMIGKSVERCREMLHLSLEETGSISPVMQPVRNMFGRVRAKLRPFGIKIQSMVLTGYILIPAHGGIRP